MASEKYSFARHARGVILRLRKALENPGKLLKQIGYILLEDSQRSFEDQRFGEIKWPPRYPKQSSPKVNIAGIVQDFTMGRTKPPARRFQDRPAGIDTGILRRSLQSGARAVGVSGYTVTVGSTIPWAGKFHSGGVSRQKITSGVKTLLAKFLRSKFGKQYRPRLGWLFQRDTLVTRTNPRPIVGVTDKAEKRIIETIQNFLQPPPTGGASGRA